MNRNEEVRVLADLDEVGWQGTRRCVKGDLVTEATRLKKQPGPDLLILGSGSIVSQLTGAQLIDQYQIVLCPVVLGRGRRSSRR